VGRYLDIIKRFEQERANQMVEGQPPRLTAERSTQTPEPGCGGKDSPKARLHQLLATWAWMDESAWPEANVQALYEDILDLFRDHPGEADAWFKEWRAAHPAARLA